jgi:hypothetical protein
MYLMTSTRHGVAAKELERQIGCTYKTAWRMAHEPRKLMAQADYSGPMGGIVEADETYLGGGFSELAGSPLSIVAAFEAARALCNLFRACTNSSI